MKNIGTIALLISLAITGYLLWDTQKQLASTEDDALHFMELAGRASELTLAMTRYGLGEIDIDSVIVVKDYYGVFLDSVNVRWEER